jgi:hypothetical protein
MYTGLQHFHSFWAYVVIITVLVALINAIIGFTGNKIFTAKDRRLGLFALIASHIQLLLGLILYFVSPLAAGGEHGFGGAMKNSTLRLYMLEHPLVMIISIVLITIGYSRSKRIADDKGKFKIVSIMYTLAFVLILSRIPWNEWFN